MKRIINVLLATFVLTLVPATHACAQWKFNLGYKEGLAAVMDANDKWGFIDKTGKVIIPCKWKQAYGFFEGLAHVEDDNDKWGFIDKTGKVVIPCKWKEANGFSEGLALVRDANFKCGYVDKTGKLVIPCKWWSAWPFRGGLASVWDDNRNEYKIDKTGKIVSPTSNSSSSSYSNRGSGKTIKIDWNYSTEPHGKMVDRGLTGKYTQFKEQGKIIFTVEGEYGFKCILYNKVFKNGAFDFYSIDGVPDGVSQKLSSRSFKSRDAMIDAIKQIRF